MMPCDISSGPGDVLPARSASVHASRMARSTPRRLSRCDASALLASSSAFTDVLARIHDPGTSALQPHPYLEYRSPAAARAGVVAAASNPSTTTAQRAAAENQLSRALFNLQATAEAYPQLQANQNFMDLQNQLKELENKIAYARQFYNDVVLKLNTAIETVPTNIIAGLFHFEQAQYFEADDASRQVPQVQF